MGDDSETYHPESDGDSNLVKHARRELALIGEDPETIAGVCRVIQVFADMGHSGGSASVVIPMINDLLWFRNLSPLTDDPEEWHHHEGDVWGEEGGIWQNRRNSEAFSKDGGKTYYLLSEDRLSDEHKKNRSVHIWHESKKSNKA